MTRTTEIIIGYLAFLALLVWIVCDGVWLALHAVYGAAASLF